MRLNLSYLKLIATILLLDLAALCMCPILAQSTSTSQLQGWLDQATLTGDWGGVRTRLENPGIEPSAQFLTESAANPVGGRAQAACYTPEIDFGAGLDLNRLVALPNGKAQITLTNDTGCSLSDDAIASQFQVQELFWGTYLIANQMICRFHPQSRRSLRIGGLAGMGDPETARFNYFVSGGWILRGTFSHRDSDFLAMAVAYVHTNPRLIQFQEDRDTVRPGRAQLESRPTRVYWN